MATWVARLVALTGIVDIVGALLPPHRMRLRLAEDAWPLIGIQLAHAATVAVGLLLVFLGAGLRRRKRNAWLVATALAGVSVLLNVFKGFDLGGASLSAALLALLWATRAEFRAVADPASRWRALAALSGFWAAGFGLGLVEIGLRSDRLVGHPPFRLWVIHVTYGMVGVSGPLRFTSPMAGRGISLTTGTLGLLAIATALILLLRPAPRRPVMSVEDESRLRGLLAAHGAHDSLGYFALRRDKSLIWSATGKAAVAYRVLGGVSLAAGDPIGDPEAWPGAIKAWLAESARHGWTPAVLGCGERAGQAFVREGLDAIELGDEAIIELDDFSLDGRAMRSVRQAASRIERAGYRCHVAYQQDLTPSTLALAVSAAERLRDGDAERGFSMALSRIGDRSDDDCVLALAWDSQDRLRGLLQFVPWGPDGLSLDLMRRDRTADNGLIEFMVVTVLQRAAGLGVRRVSLNFAVLRSVFERGDRLGAGPVLRLWRGLLLVMSRFWQIESLYRANAKYQPTWRPRYLCFPGLRDLPRIGIAALRAEAFLTLPRRMTPWR